MKRFPSLVCIAGLSFLLVQCDKRVDNENEDFVGVWRAELLTTDGHIELEIDDRSHARYEEWNGAQRVSLVAGVARVKDDVFIIDNRLRLAIHEWPSLQTKPGQPATWSMVLNNRRYYQESAGITADPVAR